MEAIVRQEYIEKIEHYLGKDTIIILTGQRRIGKSYLLRSFRDKLLESEQNSIIFIDKEKKEFDDIRTYQDLNSYIDSHLAIGKSNYILIDEIQDVEGFERTVRSYREEENIEIIITGSNSKMLSSDLSTLIGGRYKEIYVQALSYKEFLQFHRLADTDKALLKYIQYGGLPGLRKMGLDELDAREYQQDVYHTVLLKDVVMRGNIRNVTFLENFVRFLSDNIGKIISANSIAKYMKSQGENITSAAVSNYLNQLCGSYIIHRVSRYDIHGKRLLETNDKFYFEDHGIRNTLSGSSREGDIEKVLENIVYSHLIRLGYNVFIGQLQAGEIDFVCERPEGKRVYVQVSYIIADEDTRKREFGSLRSIRDNYPKYVISLTPFIDRTDSEGIIHLHLMNFLRNGLE